MRAIVQRALGGPEVLTLEEVNDLEPGPGQVRLGVEVSGVHLIDTRVRAGVGPMGPTELPMIPGREVAGAVDAVGDGADPAWIGQRVVAHLGLAHGGYASAAIADQDALFVVPDHVALADAVAMLGTGRTALGILEVADLRPGEVALITGATGGVGALLVQAARRAGATVIGAVAGERKFALVEGMGVDLAVDYGRPDWERVVEDKLGSRPVTVALDGVGGEIGRSALELCGPGGRMVFFGFASGAPTTFTAGELLVMGIAVAPGIGARVASRPGGIEGLSAQALDELASGRLVPLVHPPFPLADAADAHRAIEARETIGKVVLVP